MRNISLSCLFLASMAVAQDNQILFARYPHISHGKIAFSYHGDIWVADEDGSDVRNLTNHVASDRASAQSFSTASCLRLSDRSSRKCPTSGSANQGGILRCSQTSEIIFARRRASS